MVHTSWDPLWTSPASYTHNHLGRDWLIGGENIFHTLIYLLQTQTCHMPHSPLGEDILTQQDTTVRCTTKISCLPREVLSSLYKVGCININLLPITLLHLYFVQVCCLQLGQLLSSITLRILSSCKSTSLQLQHSPSITYEPSHGTTMGSR